MGGKDRLVLGRVGGEALKAVEVKVGEWRFWVLAMVALCWKERV